MSAVIRLVPCLGREEMALIVAANEDLGVSMAGLVRRVVVVAECDLCRETHPADHLCEAKVRALLHRAASQITTSGRALERIRRETQTAPIPSDRSG